MKRTDLDHAFDPTPHVFTNRVDAVLHTLKEDEPVKKFTLRTILIALPLTMLLCGIAFAIVSMQGLEWYYGNHSTAYQENDQEKQKAIFEHLQTEVPQEPSEDSKGLIDVTVQDYAWVPSQNLFTLSLAARVKDSDAYELHSMMNMDRDGFWTPVLDPKDEEGRTEHWLTTKKGFGPPADVMDDPAKTLLLVDMDSSEILIGNSGAALDRWGFNSFAGEDSAVIAVMEIDLKQLDTDYLAHRYDGLEPLPSVKYTALHPDDTGDAVVKLQEALAEQGYYHGDMDGLYNDGVSSAVVAFQKAHQLVADGIAGSITQSKLYGTKDDPGAGGEAQATDAPDARLQESTQLAIEQANAANAAIEQYTDAEGMLSLRLPYQIVPFENGGYGTPVDGVAVFKVKIR